MAYTLIGAPTALGYCPCVGKHEGSIGRMTQSIDIFAIITLLVVGILGVKGIIPMPPAGAYACIGGSITVAILLSCTHLYLLVKGLGAATHSLTSSITTGVSAFSQYKTRRE